MIKQSILPCAALAFSTSAVAETFGPNDISILLEAPFAAEDQRLPLPGSAFSSSLAARVAKEIEDLNERPGLKDSIPDIDTTLLREGRPNLHISSLRIDPGAPGLHEAFAPFGRALQIRLVVQPVDMDLAQPVTDEALHLVYQFGARDPGDGTCVARIMPSDDDIEQFDAALDALAKIRDAMRERGIDTAFAPLGVHPAFANADAASALVADLTEFVSEHLNEGDLTAVSIAGVPPGQPEPWVFAAFNLGDDGTIVPFPSPAVQQALGGGADGHDNIRQMLSFIHDRQVLPEPMNRNALPVDCFFNKVLAEAGLGMPAPEAGVSTATLFSPGVNSEEEAAAIGAVIADATRSHFFNTDCVSCHTETRREMDASADPDAVAERIAQAHHLVAGDLPRGPAGSFDSWNIRAFGWFPGFRQIQERAHATVVRRTAAETEEVLACLNHGNWRDLERPCVAGEEVRIDAQGWTDDVRRRFYHTSQGGRIMPADWFNALPTRDPAIRFASTENLRGYGLLPSETDAHNPDGWPIGFARTLHEGEEYVSLNCAACHTANVVAGDVILRLDGAPAAFDFDSFAADLANVVSDTIQMTLDQDRNPVPTPQFRAFLAALAQNDPSMADPAQAIPALLQGAAEFTGRMALRHPAHPSGPGRVDALTQITNAVTVKDLGVPSNFAVPKAPTSYPPLWEADELEYVQYNLAVADPLVRNLGQALGVFGSVELEGPGRFTSSAHIAALQSYEKWIEMLDVPAWPEDVFGLIDEERAEAGRDLFLAHCESCHNGPPYRMTDAAHNENGNVFREVAAISIDVIGTDPVYNKAFTQRWAQSGALEGLPISATRLVGPVEPASLLLGLAVRATTQGALGGTDQMRMRPGGVGFCTHVNQDMAPCGYAPPKGGSGLKAGPLLAVWATGPYLHNGSVRTIDQLLSPPEMREEAFFVGDRRIDPENLGFFGDEVPGAFLFDTRIAGNGNNGHVVPLGREPFTEDERKALIEYLKDPERFPLPADRVGQ